MPKISSKALRTLGVDSILGLHQKSGTRVPKDEKRQRGEDFTIEDRTVRYQIRGALNGRFSEAIQSFGVPISKDAMIAGQVKGSAPNIESSAGLIRGAMLTDVVD